MEPPTQSPHSTRDLALLMGLAVAYRLLFAWAMPRAIDSPDAVGYLTTAMALAAGDMSVLASNLPLLYPLLVAPLIACGLQAEHAGMGIALLAGLALIPAVYAVARMLFDRSTACVAGLTVAVWPWLADYSWRISPDGLALTLWFAAFALLVQAMRQGRWWPVAAGLAFWALHLARPEGTFLFLGSSAVAVVLAWGTAHGVRRYALLAGVTLTGIALQALTTRALAGAAVINPRVADPASSLRYVLVERASEAAQALLTLVVEITPLMVGPYLFLFAGLALLRVDRQRDWRGEAALLLFAAGHILLAAMSTYPEPRYVLAPVVAIALWGARGVAMAATALAQSSGTGTQTSGGARFARWRGFPVAGLLLWHGVFTAVTVLPEHMGRLPRMPHEYRLAGEWLRDHAEPGLLITRRTQIGFYAGMPSTGPGDHEPLDDLLARAQRIGARYLVVEERHGIHATPSLAPLLDPKQAPPSLRLMNDTLSPYAEGRVVIYEILPP